MKRILSLTLVAVMLLSTLMLTSCNEVFDAVGGFVGGVIDYFTPGPNYRTEITEMEWYKVAANTNFTISASGDGQEMTLVVDDLLLKADVDYETYQINLICDLKNGVLISETSVGWLASKNDSISAGIPELTLGTIGYFPSVEFSELVYDAEKGAYTHSTDYINCEYFFRDGVLYEGKMTSKYADEVDGTTMIISNVGTSVVEIGEYTIINDGKVDPSKAPTDVRTTVTNEDLAAHLDMRNFTINAATMQMVFGIDISLKMADTAAELLVSAMGEDAMKQYLAFVDDNIYSIEKYGDGYLATRIAEVTMQEINETIEMAKEYMTTDYLVYNEEGRYYVLEVEGYKFYLYFENGKLVKGEMIIDQEILGGAGSTSPYAENDNENYLEIVFVVNNIGTTTVTLPEYTIDENIETVIPPTYEGVVTEEQWNEQTNAINYTVESVAQRTRISTGESLGEYSTHFKTAENGAEEPGHNYPYRAYLDNGVYNITYNKETERYEATKTDYSVEDFSISSQTIGEKLNYSDFTYNEYQGRYEGNIIVDDREYQMYLYFNNGELEAIGVTLYVYEQDLKLVATVLISDIGTTVVELPEYVIVE